MIPKVLFRKVGEVDVIELKGFVCEPWAKRTREQMTEVLEANPAEGLLLNMREVAKVDDEGAGIILETLRKSKRSGILGRNLPVHSVVERMEAGDPVRILAGNADAVNYFSRELALSGEEIQEERRRYPRIQTALPVEFEMKDLEAPFFFEAVVTNLSESGLYAHFLDSEMEELAGRTLNPFDLKLLEIRLSLPGGLRVTTEGKVLREKEEGPGVRGAALEFYQLKASDLSLIRNFLKQVGEKEAEEEKK